MKDNKQELKFSVVDVEKKYTVDPTETVYGGGNGIVSWGSDNQLPSLLGTCYDKSATLKAVIDQSVNYIKGDDVVVNDDAAYWKEKVNRRGLSMAELIEHIAMDYMTYGNFAIQVIFNKLGAPVELYPLDVARCRVNGAGTKVFYSKKLWTKYQSKADEYDRFGHKEFDPEKPTQIYFYNGTGVRRYYGRSPWFSALDDVLTEIESSHYMLSNVSNGFSARYLINFPQTANLTDSQKEAINDGIKKKFCGSDGDSNFMLYWTDGTQGLDVKKIERNEDPEYLQAVRNGVRENIFISMRMSPLLCGLGSEKTGFSSSEYSDSYKLYEKSVAQPFRDTLQRAVDDVTGVKDSITIVPFSIKFEDLG